MTKRAIIFEDGVLWHDKGRQTNVSFRGAKRRRISWKRLTINSYYYIINLIVCIIYRICRKSILLLKLLQKNQIGDIMLITTEIVVILVKNLEVLKL